MIPTERKFWTYRLFRLLCWSYLKIFHRYETRGAENVPVEGGCIVAANHASFMDPPVAGCGPMHRVVRFMARDTLYKKRFIRWFFLKLATLPISRDGGDIAALKKSIQILKDGGCLGLFPEGTRTTDGSLQSVKVGLGFLIAKAGVPVVPAYIDGTFAAYSRHAKSITHAKIQVFYGVPITPAEIATFGRGRDSYEKISNLVMQRIAELRAANISH